ncbi:adenosylcobinamide-phosphate synthase CbiB [Clostridium sp. CX1]|uniref:Cobalamin biosynthesis protein CobD n=1 Tax=Clostridium tanneri TaxID=3037988 RepID=A0ABU4JUM2_9CLOT|nr:MULTISPECIES: adenosylcobinamide-phosphate synthase CbiB [unclassified Clostridium]MCT8976642.1 adenosylcobinamide-phosphate synthase CbiB [Clostridium sp. CX1]MDW8801855.1 adenosylcobinamide-phosphate synthase CbiB [Clostridium sp. A1-XYC3]
MITSFFITNTIAIFLAVILDWIIGDPYWFPHPVIYIGKLISFLEKRGRKFCKTNKGIKFFGGLIVVIVASISFMIPFILLKLIGDITWLYIIINTVIIWTTLAAKCLAQEAKKVYYALKDNNLGDARVKLSYIVGRDTTELSDKEIIRADVETVAENAADGVIAPLFYAIIGGAPLAMMYKGINTMDSMLGYMNEKYRHIGFFPAKVDDVFNFIPARITGFLICVVAFVVKGNMVESFKIMIRDRKNHKSPNCAYPEGAAAGAMKVQLGGTNVYFGEVVYKPTIGDKIKELSFEHINDSVKLMYAAETLMMILYAAVVLTTISS